jgi:uncharacterized membrane protein YeiH
VTDATFQVPILFDYVATFTWAVSGAIVAIRKRFDIIGVFIVALPTAIGGGLVRDAVFLNRTPVFLLDPAYLSLVVGATIGTPAFAVFGMELTERAGLPLIAIVFVGVANGAAGGLCATW